VNRRQEKRKQQDKHRGLEHRAAASRVETEQRLPPRAFTLCGTSSHRADAHGGWEAALGPAAGLAPEAAAEPAFMAVAAGAFAMTAGLEFEGTGALPFEE